MLCKIFPINYHKIGFGISLLALPVVLSVFFSSDTSAISDYVVVVDTPGVTVDICGRSSNVNCDDYDYLYFEPSGFTSFNYINFQAGSYNLRFPNFENTYLSLRHGLNNMFYAFTLGTIYSNGEYVTITLSDSLPSSNCPVCEECQTCPAIPDNPYDDKFDKIIVAIYTCGGIMLALYFFFCIYRMFIRSVRS